MAKQQWREKTASSPAAQRRVAAATTRSFGRWRDQPLGLAAFFRAQSRLLRFPLVFTAFLVALAATAVIISWLSPLHRPQLTIISSAYNDPLLPHSALSTRDARALGQLGNLFDVTNSSAGGLKYDELRELIRSLPETPVAPRFFAWQKTSRIVYVNAAGIAVPDTPGGRLVPYLLPSDFRVGQKDAAGAGSRGVPLADLLDAFAQCPVDHKLLVLDCQSIDQLWSHGIVHNRFVETVQEQLQNDKYAGLSVIFSCSPGQLTWNHTAAGHSAFGWFFLKAVTGAADLTGGDQDGRVTLREVFQYLQTNVQDWVRNNRDDNQRPILVTRGRPENIVLAVLSRRSAAQQDTFLDLPSTAEREQVLAGLRVNWQDYYTLARQEPHPAHRAPHIWQRLETALLAAESCYRDYDFHTARTQVEAFRLIRGELNRVGDLLPRNAPLYSLPARQLFPQDEPAAATPADDASAPAPPAASPAANPGGETVAAAPTANASGGDAATPAAAPGTAPAAASPAGTAPGAPPSATGDAPGKDAAPGSPPSTPAPPPKPLSPADVADLLQAIERNDAVALEVGALLLSARYTAKDLPVEAELLRTMAEHGPHGASPEEASTLRQAAQLLVQNRIQAERAAIPAGADSAGVFRWIRGWVDHADLGLRQAEDEFFAFGHPAAPLGTTISDRSLTTESYDTALLAAERLARAHRTWETALAELPYLVRFALLRPWDSRSLPPGPNAFHQYVSDQTRTLLDNVAQLTRALEAAPESLSPAARARHISGIHDLAAAIDQTRAALRQRIAAETAMFRKLKDHPHLQSEAQFRQLEALLTIPFPCAGDASVAELADLRLHMLQGLQKPVDQAPHETAALHPPEEVSPEEFARWQRARDELVRTWALAFLSLSDANRAGAGSAAQQSPGYSEAVARAWNQTWTAATTTRFLSDDPIPLFHADVASRLLDAILVLAPFNSYEETPTRRRMQRELGAYLAWLGQRHAEDFWAGPRNRARPYFADAAGQLLQLARQIDTHGSAPLDELSARLTALTAFSRQLHDRNGEGVLEVIPPVLPFRGTDLEQIRIKVGSPSCPVRSIARVRCLANPADLTVTSLPPASEAPFVFPFETRRVADGSPDTILSAELFLRGHVCARPVPVEIAAERGPTVVYRNPERREAELNVRSAESTTEASHVLFVIDCSRSMLEQDRIGHVRDTLLKFADVAAQNGLSVGIRVFGDTVVWRKGDTKAEQAARKDSRLLLPIEPFTEKRFREAVAQIRARGETPLFHALLEARRDFDRITQGAKTIVVISDGADNWARLGLPPGPLEIQTAFQNSNIQVNAIGFQTDDVGYQQLGQIAAATAGQCVQAEQADELLASVFGQIRLHRYTVTRLAAPGSAAEVFTAPLKFRDDVLLVPPGLYDLRVTDLADAALAERRQVQIRPGERHELLFGGNALNYPSLNLTQDVARAGDAGTRTLLRVMRAEVDQQGLLMRLALLNELQPEWRPAAVEIRLRPRGDSRVFTVQNLPENVPGYHFPVWEFRVENWPAGADVVQAEISWSEGKAIDRETYTLDWSSDARDAALPEGFRITRRRVEAYPVDGELQNTAVVTLVFPRGYPNPQDWSVSFREPVAFARQVYNADDGVYSGRFTFQSGKLPEAILVHGPRSTQARSRLSANISLRLQQIN